MPTDLERENERLRHLVMVADWLIRDSLGDLPTPEGEGCRGRMRNKAQDLIRAEVEKTDVLAVKTILDC